MSSKSYEPEEIQNASPRNLDAVDPETAFFLGPTSESDLVYAFANKLDALHFLKSYYEDYLSKEEQGEIDSEIALITATMTDAGTRTCAELLRPSDSVEIYAEGYWDDFIPMTQPFWDEWMENSGELFPDQRFWDDDEDDVAMSDAIEEEANEGSLFVFDEPPDDVYHPEFVESIMLLLPIA